MHPLPTLIILLLSGASVLAQGSSTNPPCIQSCLTGNPISSWCNGDETGSALDKCLCQTYQANAGGKLFACIKACPVSEQSAFAAKIPAQCRGAVLPGVTAAASSSSASLSSSTTTGATTSGLTIDTRSATTARAAATSTSTGAAPAFTAQGVAAVGGLLMMALGL